MQIGRLMHVFVKVKRGALLGRTLGGLIMLLLLSGCARVDFDDRDKPFLPKMGHMSNARLALVLGSGGVKGIAHVGVLEVLSAAGIVPDLVVGCSAGAIVGSMYAEGQPVRAIKRKLVNTSKSDLLGFSSNALPVSIYGDHQLNDYLKKMLVSRRFNQTRIAFAAIATNLQFGKETIFSTGELIPAIQASAAIPGVYPPVMIGKQPFVDGAVSAPVPVRAARDLGARIVIAVDVSNSQAVSRPSNLIGVMKRSLEISYIHSAKCSSRDADIVIKVPLVVSSPFDDKQNEKIYEAGRKAALASLPKIKSVIRKRIISQMLH